MYQFREAREQAGLTRQTAATSLGVTTETLRRWETGETYPTVPALIAMAELYGKTVDELLGL